MHLYRVVKKENFLDGKICNEKEDGEFINTFDYDDRKYVHFFVLPECAEIYKKLKYDNVNIQSVVTKWNIPYSLIKDNFGVGLYRWYDPSCRSPFLEVRILEKDLRKSMLDDCAETMPEEWKNPAIYKRYLHCLGIVGRSSKVESPLYFDIQGSIIDQLEKTPKLNNEFNFLNYFPVKDLKKEGLTNEYCDTDDMLEIKSDVKKRRINIFSKKR